MLETNRLCLRPFVFDDAAAMYANWAADQDVLRYMPYNVCNTLEETQAAVKEWLSYFDGMPKQGEAFALVEKTSGSVIGTIDYLITDQASQAAEIGYQLGKQWWGNGFAAEALIKLISHCFKTVGLNRLWGAYDPRNPASGRVMEKAGMAFEGHMRQYKVRRGERVDRIIWAIIKDEYDTQQDIAAYNTLPVNFDGFISMPQLSNNEIFLVCTKKQEADSAKGRVPSYSFAICKQGEQIGNINLRIGYSARLYYGGQIGYEIYEEYRGNSYATQACSLLAPVARAHGMQKLLITNDVSNAASIRVCEKLGAKLLRKVTVPQWHDLYKADGVLQNVFEWQL